MNIQTQEQFLVLELIQNAKKKCDIIEQLHTHSPFSIEISTNVMLFVTIVPKISLFMNKFRNINTSYKYNTTYSAAKKMTAPGGLFL